MDSHNAINFGGWIEVSAANAASLVTSVSKHFLYDLNKDSA